MVTAFSMLTTQDLQSNNQACHGTVGQCLIHVHCKTEMPICIVKHWPLSLKARAILTWVAVTAWNRPWDQACRHLLLEGGDNEDHHHSSSSCLYFCPNYTWSLEMTDYKVNGRLTKEDFHVHDHRKVVIHAGVRIFHSTAVCGSPTLLLVTPPMLWKQALKHPMSLQSRLGQDCYLACPWCCIWVEGSTFVCIFPRKLPTTTCSVCSCWTCFIYIRDTFFPVTRDPLYTSHNHKLPSIQGFTVSLWVPNDKINIWFFPLPYTL